jgi:hypothetical protein
MKLEPGQLLSWTVEKVDLNGVPRAAQPFIVIRVYDLDSVEMVDLVEGDKILQAWRSDYVRENAEIMT